MMMTVLLNAHKAPEQSFKRCISLMKLVERYNAKRVEKSCEIAFSYTPGPNIMIISGILKNNQDKPVKKNVRQTVNGKHALTRRTARVKGCELK